MNIETYNPSNLTLSDLGVSMENIRCQGYCPVCGKFHSLRCPHKVRASYFFVDFMYKGIRIRRGTNLDGETLKTLNQAIALKQEAFDEIRQDRFNPGKWTRKPKIDFTFKVLVEKWYQEKKREVEQGRLKPGYVTKIWQYIRNYFHYFDNADVRSIFNVKDFALWLPERLLITYQRNIVSTLRTFFHWLKDNRYIKEIPVFPKFETPDYLPRTIDYDTQMKIVAFIPDEHKPIFLFLIYQGCRPSEARALKWDCIEGEVVYYRRTFSNEMLMESTKTRKITANRLFPETLAILPKRTFALDFVFKHGVKVKRHYSKTYLNNLFREALEKFNEHYKTDLKVKLYEATKHSFHTQLYNQGVPLDVLRKWSGHTSIKTTEKYAKLDVVNAFNKIERIRGDKKTD